MARGNEIICQGEARGIFKEGYISGAIKPGCCMTPKAAIAPRAGKLTWEPYNVDADGKPSIVAILLGDSLQGKLSSDAYVDGTRCFLYVPAAGEEVNVYFQNQPGTADDVAIGDRFMLDDGTGQLIAQSSGVMIPFIALEPITDPSADQLLWCLYTGN